MLGSSSNSSTKAGQSEELAELVSSYKKQRSIEKKSQLEAGPSGLNLNSLSFPWECNLDSNIEIKTEKDLQLDTKDFGLSAEPEPPLESVPPKKFFQWYKMHNFHAGEKNAVSFSSMMTDSSSYEEQYLGLKIFLAACSASYKRELSSILFPLFVHFYLDIVCKPDLSIAQAFYNKFHTDHEENHKDLLQFLPKISMQSQIAQNTPINELRKSKIILKLSIHVYNYFLQHLRHGNFSLVLQTLNRYFTIRSSSSFNNGQYFNENFQDDVEEVMDDPYCLPLEQAAIDRLRNSIDEMGKCSKLLKPSICMYSVHNAHQGICCSSFSTKFSQLAAGFEDSSIRLWNIVSQTVIDASTDEKPHKENSSQSSSDISVFRGHQGAVYQITFFHNDEYMLSSSRDKTVRLWNIHDKRNLVSYNGHAYTVWDVGMNENETYFVSASLDKTLRLWNTEYACPLRILAGHSDSVDCVAFHPNGNYVASGSSDKTCRLWDIQSGQFVRVFVGHQGPIYSLAFSSDGKYLVSAGDDTSIKIWDLSNGQLLNEVKSHSKTVYSLAFSKDGSMLASGGLDKTIRVWENETLFRKKNSSSTSSIFKMAAAADNCLLGSYPIDNISSILDLKFSSGNLLYSSVLSTPNR